MASEIVRDIAAKLRIVYDTGGFQQFAKDIQDNIQKMRGLAAAYQAVAKAQQDINTKQLAAESKQLTIENKKLTLESKQLTIESKKKALAVKDLALENKKLAIELKAVRLAQQKARGEQYTEQLQKQKAAAKGLTTTLDGVKDSLIAMGVAAIASGLFKIALKTERAIFRIQNLIDQTALKSLEKRFNILNKQSDDLFSASDFRESAAAVLLIDKNTGRFAQTMEFAIKQAPVLGKTLREVQEGLALGFMGDEEALTQLGLITPLALEEMRRRTGLSLGDLRSQERVNFVLNLMKLSARQIGQADKAAVGLGATWKRFTTLLQNGSDRLNKDFKPVVIFLLKGMTGFLRMLASSPIGVFVLRLGGLVAGLATLVLGISALTKALVFLKAVTLKLNAATLLLMGKFIFWGTLIIGLIVLIDDLWLAATGPKDADTIFGKLGKKINKFFKDIGFEDFVKNIDKWIDNILGKVFDALEKIIIGVKDFFANRLTGEINNFFKNIGFESLITDIDKSIDKFLEGIVDKLLNALNRIKNLLNSVGIGKGANISFFDFIKEATGFSADDTNFQRFLSLLSGGGVINQTPPRRQLNPDPEPGPQIDSSTAINFGSNTFSYQGGLGRQEIISLAVEEYRRELQKEFNEANIGAQ